MSLTTARERAHTTKADEYRGSIVTDRNRWYRMSRYHAYTGRLAIVIIEYTHPPSTSRGCFMVHSRRYFDSKEQRERAWTWLVKVLGKRLAQ